LKINIQQILYRFYLLVENSGVDKQGV